MKIELIRKIVECDLICNTKNTSRSELSPKCRNKDRSDEDDNYEQTTTIS